MRFGAKAASPSLLWRRRRELHVCWAGVLQNPDEIPVKRWWRHRAAAVKDEKGFSALKKHDVNWAWGGERFGADSTSEALWLENGGFPVRYRVTGPQDKERFPSPFAAGSHVFQTVHIVWLCVHYLLKTPVHIFCHQCWKSVITWFPRSLFPLPATAAQASVDQSQLSLSEAEIHSYANCPPW